MPTRQSGPGWRPSDYNLTVEGALGSDGDGDGLHPLVEPLEVARGSAAVMAAMFGKTQDLRIGRYLLLERIGEGGMGVVFRAYDPQLRRELAIKVLHPSVEASAERTLREAQALAQLSHPNVVPIHDVGTDAGRTFLAMAYLEGDTVSAWREAASRPWQEIVEVFIKAGRGLAAAHARGLVHRDFKPDNVLVGHDGRVHVLDFGLAKSTDGPELPSIEESPELETSALDLALTDAGRLVGTPAYLAPERYLGAPATAAADQYAYCVALFEAVSGKLPFRASTLRELVSAKAAGLTTAPDMSPAPKRLAQILRQGLAPAPGDRFASMDELLARLEKTIVPRAPRRVLAAGGLLVLGLAAGGVAMTRADPCERPAFVDEVWNADTARALEAAFVHARPEDGAAAASDLSHKLDRYAQRWRVLERESCEATEVRRTQPAARHDARRQCLHDAALVLQSFIASALDATPEVVAESHASVAWLPSLGRCGEGAVVGVPPPDDADAAAVSELEAELRDATAESAVGRRRAALQTIEDLARRADPIPYPPLSARIAVARGRIERSLGEYEAAKASLVGAFDDAIAAGDDATATDAAVHLAWTAQSLREVDDGLRWVGHARAFAGRAPASLLHGARLDLIEGMLHARAGRLDEALRLVKRSRDAHESSPDLGSDHPSAVLAVLWHATVLGMRGEYSQCLELAEQALSRIQAIHGPDHARAGAAYELLASAHAGLGDYEASIEANKNALRIIGLTRAPLEPAMFAATTNIAVNYGRMGDLEQSEAYADDALAIARHSYPPTHLGSIRIRLYLAELRFRTDRNEEAEAMLGELCRDAEQVDTPAGKGLLSACWSLRAHIALARGDLDEAVRSGRAGVDAVDGLEFSDKARSDALAALARAYQERGEPRTALEHAERALDAAERSGLADSIEASRAAVEELRASAP